MKSLYTLLAALFLSLSAAAQSGQGFLNFSYQAVIRNSSGALITNRSIAMRVSLLQGSATGAAVYVETHAPTTNANGLATLAIGGGTPVSGNFFSIVWSTPGGYFLKIEIDPLGGGINYTITGTTQLLSVPYAMYAQFAGTSGTSQDLQIGQLYGGGIIFSLWRDHVGVQHGLIASLDDLGTQVAWANPGLSATVSPNVKDGRPNTAAILAARPTGSAAALCAAYRSGGFSDWYLPALMEIELLYSQSALIDAVLSADGNSATNGLGQEYYWTSTSVFSSFTNGPVAWAKIFQVDRATADKPGSSFGQGHTSSLPMRAIRRF